MYQVDIKTIFNNKDIFLDRLIESNVQDPATLDLISYEIIHQDKFDTFGVSFLNYLIDTMSSSEQLLLVKLSCINKHFMEYLADEELNVQARSIIFSYCLKVRNSKQDLFDAEVHHLIYSILERCSFSADAWQKELDQLSQEKRKKLLQTYDRIIEDYIYNPRAYPDKIVIDPEVTDTACIRFALFNVLYESEMRPIQFENDNAFNFSDNWITFLKLKNIGKGPFAIEAQLIKNALRNPEKKLACYVDDRQEEFSDTLEMMASRFGMNYEDLLDTMIRECIQCMIHTHPRFITVLAWCLVNLMHFAKQKCKHNVYQQYIMMCEAAWLQIFQSLLEDVVFEYTDKIPNYKSSHILSRYCSAFAQYDRYVQHDDMDDFYTYIKDIWKKFYRTRTVYLKSTHITDGNLTWLETMILTSTTTRIRVLNNKDH